MQGAKGGQPAPGRRGYRWKLQAPSTTGKISLPNGAGRLCFPYSEIPSCTHLSASLNTEITGTTKIEGSPPPGGGDIDGNCRLQVLESLEEGGQLWQGQMFFLILACGTPRGVPQGGPVFFHMYPDFMAVAFQIQNFLLQRDAVAVDLQIVPEHPSQRQQRVRSLRLWEKNI